MFLIGQYFGKSRFLPLKSPPGIKNNLHKLRKPEPSPNLTCGISKKTEALQKHGFWSPLPRRVTYTTGNQYMDTKRTNRSTNITTISSLLVLKDNRSVLEILYGNDKHNSQYRKIRHQMKLLQLPINLRGWYLLRRVLTMKSHGYATTCFVQSTRSSSALGVGKEEIVIIIVNGGLCSTATDN